GGAGDRGGWKGMMGGGRGDPVDDLRATTPAPPPRLLDRLAEDFVKHGCDARHTLRLIANSSAYQRGGSTNDLNRSDDRFYSRALVRPLPAEVRADAIAAVTGVSDRFGDLPPGTRAITLFDSQVPAPAVDVLGGCPRAGPCEEDAASSGGLARTLHLINGPLLNAKIDAAEGRLRKLLAGKHSDARIVEEFYLRALGRSPDGNERAFWAKNLTGARTEDERREAFEDFLWGL